MALLLPAYLNESLIQTALESGLDYPRRTRVQLLQCRFRCATTVGDNYLSDVFRAWVRFRRLDDLNRDEDISLIVKCMPADGHRGSVIEELNVFEKEVLMFRDVVPQLSEAVGREQFAAKLYYATEDPIRMIVFQDLNAINYTMTNRTNGGLDLNHCMLIMRKIAKFHAASMIMACKSPTKRKEFEQDFGYGFLNPKVSRENNTVMGIFTQGLSTLIECASKWTNLDSDIVKKLRALKPVYKERLEKSLNQQCLDGFKVMNHGDLWSNNMLFKYCPDGTPQDVIFVDYQLSCYTSPGVDLNYSLVNCPTFEVREKHRDGLIAEYHKTLTAVLKEAGYEKIPSLADVKKEIQRMNFYSFFAAVAILPIVTMESIESGLDVGLDALADEKKAEQLRLHQYNGDRYRRSIVVLLQRFNREGLLD
ncbi:uncharacterized protein LOC6037948 [Culex quinquefasciatus]|uniref:uncharacterized protein LOC6037948 n=1 Tax=Culex quinquefasciatus TaxID=7176 RepID=UPI0018E36B1B|nr:uncharacterized protein LOC6037948 [Culex quinquefasciatus]